ncbi:replication initiation protein [Salinibacter altiplanensis]|uniref:replication initiation protein n=1 Tax=Salinibacter altiplanensis TaxID=1803181 RepID=UPI000C9EF594|nr:replication initiation protein [Salinibacter altiplanensis]
MGSTGEMIVKANQLVQAKMPLSKVEHRVIGALISQLDKDDEEFGYQKLYIRDLIEGSRTNHQALYHRAEDICSSLLEKKLEIKRAEDGKRKYTGISLMNRCEYKEGDGYIRAKFNEEMAPYLLQLKKRFTMYEAGHFLPLRSTYSMRIFELLKMREGISILRISVEELRGILGIEDSYSAFSQLKYHVINKAQEEIAEKTDISFTYDVEREGQAAKRIKFFIHSKGDEPDTPTKIEDRTQAPDIDVVNMFLSDLSQEEIDTLDQKTIDSLHETAVEKAQRENPDRSENVVQAEAYRHMKALWEKR